MEKLKVAILQLRDNPYNVGLYLAKHFKHKPFLSVIDWATRSEINMAEMESIFSSYAPHLIDELHGIAHGLNIPYQKAAAMFSGYDFPKPLAIGCSAFITPQYYVRNYDFSPFFYDRSLVLLQPRGGASKNLLASAGYSLQVLGRHEGVNEKGLAIGLHFVSHSDYRKGLSAWTSLRMALDCCSTTAEAVQLLKEIPHANCYNFSIGDANGNMAVVEASPHQTLVRTAPDYLSAVNHFQNQEMRLYNRENILQHSQKRASYIGMLHDKNHSLQEVFGIFKDKNSLLFFQDYDHFFGTLHTIAYSFHEKSILTSIPNSGDLKIDFPKWLAGADIPQKELAGSIPIHLKTKITLKLSKLLKYIALLKKLNQSRNLGESDNEKSS